MSTTTVLPPRAIPQPVPATAATPAIGLPETTILGYAAAIAGCAAALNRDSIKAKIAGIKLCRALMPDLSLYEAKKFTEWTLQGGFCGPNGEWLRPRVPSPWPLI